MAPLVHPPPLARTRLVAPAAQALTLAEAKLHLKVTTNALDDLVLAYLAAATEAAEREVELALLTQQWEVALDGWWAGDLALPYPPLVTVDEIRYRDENDVEQVLPADVYEVAPEYRPGRVRLAPGKSWPSLYPRSEAVRVRFTCGHGGTPDAVPEGIRQAVRLLLAHNERNAEAVVRGEAPVEVPLGARWLLAKYRIPEAA